MITLESLKETEFFMERLHDRCEEIISWKNSHDPKGLIWKHPLCGYLHDFEFNSKEEKVSFIITEMAGFYDGDSDGISIPYQELISDDWKEVFIQQIQKKQQEIKNKTELKNTEVTMNQEKWEREMYEKLKMKFENNEVN